jgi:hypothetical protein
MGYSDAYNLPNDFIRLIFIGDNYNVDYETDYSIEGLQLLLDASAASSLNICYVYDITNPVKFDPLFIDLLALELALRLTPAVVGQKVAFIKEIEELLAKVRLQARAINGQENPVKVRQQSKFANSRFYSGYNNARYDKA